MTAPPSTWAELAEAQERAARAGAAWWAARLRDARGVGDNGDRSQVGAIAYALTHRLRGDSITEAMCQEFERRLVAGILAELRDWHHCYRDTRGWDLGGPDACLSVDYHPTRTLYDALILAGVPEGVAHMAALPLKTNMRISARRVMVAHGYGAKWVEIYGPAWGCTRAEHLAAEDFRFEQAALARQEWEAGGFIGPEPQWSGPIQQPAVEPVRQAGKLQRQPTAPLRAKLQSAFAAVAPVHAGKPARPETFAAFCADLAAEVREMADRGELAEFGVRSAADVTAFSCEGANVVTDEGERFRVWFNLEGTPLERFTEEV